jgi:hypothetical protein
MRYQCANRARLIGAGLVLFSVAAGTMPGAFAGAVQANASQLQIASVTSALPKVAAGFHIEVYASVSEPMKLDFGRDGALYVGRDPGNRIHRVAPGGRSVSEFGPPMVDPDAVLVDEAGLVSHVPHSVLVGGGGVLAAIFPNQAASVIFSSGFADVDDMKFDRTNRLIFSDDFPRVLAVPPGGTPTILFTTPSRPGSIAIADDNRIFVALADGSIRSYNPDGTVANEAFATGMNGLDTYLAFGEGEGGFGQALYVLNGSSLLRFNRDGKATVIGTGFSTGPSSGTGFVFGPDKALYISDYSANRILRIARGHTR